MRLCLDHFEGKNAKIGEANRMVIETGQRMMREFGQVWGNCGMYAKDIWRDGVVIIEECYCVRC